MKLILRFLKPHRKLCVIITLLMIVETVGAMLVPAFAGGILGGYSCARLAAEIGTDIREELYKKTLDLSVFDFQKFGTASMTTRTVSDVSAIQLAVVNVFQLILPVPVVFVAAIVSAFSIDPVIGLILSGFLLALIICAVLIFKGASPIFRKLQKLLDKMSTALLENITGVRVVRAFNKEEYETKRLNAAFESYKTTSVKADKMFASLDGLSYFAVNMFAVVVYWICGARISIGVFRLGDVTAVIEYAMLALYYLMMAQMLVLTLPRAFECADRVNAVLNFSPEITDQTNEFVPLDETKDVLSFENVFFRYADADEYTLKNLNFSCKKGTITGIIGGTGSGKSTIASLILRFNDVTEGAIKLNGADIREMPQRELRDNVAYVQQNAWLFSGTIAENIAYGKENATREEIERAAKAAKADYFIKTLPQGYDTILESGAANISVGQKQLLTIARVLLCDPPILILDEATSGVDTRTEAAIGEAMKSLTKGRTSFVIAHRLSTIRDADDILFMENGSVIEQGNHEELLAKGGAYAALYNSQFE